MTSRRTKDARRQAEARERTYALYQWMTMLVVIGLMFIVVFVH